MQRCRECGKGVSTRAKYCPNCGRPKPTENKLLNSIVGLSILLFLIWSFSDDSEKSNKVEVNSNADRFSTLSLNVRSGPSTEYLVIHALKPGEQIQTLKDSLGWALIKPVENNDFTNGWVSKKYIKDISGLTEWNKRHKQEAERKRKEAEVNSWKDKIDKIGAYVMIKGFVKDRLKSPSTAEFPSGGTSFYDDSVKYLDSQTYRIRSYVDSQNSFGAMIRTHFMATIKQTENGRWKLIALDFQN